MEIEGRSIMTTQCARAEIEECNLGQNSIYTFIQAWITKHTSGYKWKFNAGCIEFSKKSTSRYNLISCCGPLGLWLDLCRSEVQVSVLQQRSSCFTTFGKKKKFHSVDQNQLLHSQGSFMTQLEDKFQ
jgi:hypothetical protein